MALCKKALVKNTIVSHRESRSDGLAEGLPDEMRSRKALLMNDVDSIKKLRLSQRTIFYSRNQIP